MKALRFKKYGPPSVLAIEEVEMPLPGAGEALIEIRAAGVNPSDVKNVSGHFSATTLPRTPGRDFAGIVVEGRALSPGAEVWGSAPGFGIGRDGMHAEYAIVPEEILCRKPHNLGFEQMAAVGVPFTTAWAALVREGRIERGETILIVGARGAVGQAAVQIAHWKGARVVGAARGAAPIPGADAAVDASSAGMRDRVLDLTGGEGADLVLDTVGGPMFEPSLRSLRHGGRHIAMASTGGRRVDFDLVDFYHNESRLVGFDSQAFTPGDAGRIAHLLLEGFESGALKPPEVEVTPFRDAVTVYEKIAAGKAPRKQILTFARSGS